MLQSRAKNTTFAHSTPFTYSLHIVCNCVAAIIAIIVSVIIVINQCNFYYFMESSLNACSAIMYKGMDHKKDSGEKKEDACKIQTVFVGKSVLHRCHPWKCGEFLYIFAQKFGPTYVAKQKLWPQVIWTPPILLFSVKKHALVESKIR
jgi:hypothetical protein